MSSAELDELLELLLDCSEDDEELLLSSAEELLDCSVDDEVVVLDVLLDCAEDDEELLDCTEEELESSPQAVSDKTTTAEKTAPKILCPFFIFYPFCFIVFGTNCSFTIIYTHLFLVKRFLEIFVVY